MENLTNKSQASTIRAARVNIGVRVQPEIKDLFTRRAVALGMPISEFTESILLNHDPLQKEIEDLKKELGDLKEVKIEKDQIIEEFKEVGVLVRAKFNELKTEISELKSSNTDVTNQLRIANDEIRSNKEKHLLELSELRKEKLIPEADGKSDYLSEGILGDLLIG
jgi:HAMP domain-containing protein